MRHRALPSLSMILFFCLAVVTLIIIVLYMNIRAEMSGIESWIPVPKLENKKVAKELLTITNSRHLFIRTEDNELYALWSDEQGGYAQYWRKEEILPTFEDEFGSCSFLQDDVIGSIIEKPPEESQQYAICRHSIPIPHSDVSCTSIFSLSNQQNIFAWSKCQGTYLSYIFEYYLPRLAVASCLQEGRTKC